MVVDRHWLPQGPSEQRPVARLAAAEHAKLRKYGIWVWKEGTIEDALAVSDKGEEAIQTLEQALAALTTADVRSSYPSVADFLEWLTT